MMVMDYSENYRCRYQNEASNAYFEQRQVTVHPMMCYYWKPVVEDTVTEDTRSTVVEDTRSTVAEDTRSTGTEDTHKTLMKHAIIGISNDPCHDAAGVKVFEQTAISLIKRDGYDITRVYQFSDGCSSQYKGKMGFLNISECSLPLERNYFETSHGKNVCDGLGAIIKNACYRAVLQGKVIAGPKDVYEHCLAKLKHDAKPPQYPSKALGYKELCKRDFVYVSKGSVDRTTSDVNTLVGTRKLHSLRNIQGSLHQVQYRNLSCFCNYCLGLVTENGCSNAPYVRPWISTRLQFGTKKCELIISIQLYTHLY